MLDAIAARVLSRYQQVTGEALVPPIQSEQLLDVVFGNELSSPLWDELAEPPGRTILAGLAPAQRMIVFNARRRELLTGTPGLLNDTLGHENVPVEMVVAPGNHDCDFSDPSGARDLVRAGILKDFTQASDASVVDVCTAPQMAFFKFLDQVVPGRRRPQKSRYDPRLVYQFDIVHGDERLHFVCVNTPWMSQIHEDQGSLSFPADAVPSRSDGDGLRVALFHHPYNWIEANAARAFRKALEANFDIILTGHEHDGTWHVRRGEGGECNEYIEGGVLQESKHPATSAFNVLVIDTTTTQQSFARYSWDGSRYVPVTPQGAVDGHERVWTDLQVNRLRQRGRYEVSSEMAQAAADGAPGRDRGRLPQAGSQGR